MAKVTSKLQVTIPKRIADRYAIAPGDEAFEPTYEEILQLLGTFAAQWRKYADQVDTVQKRFDQVDRAIGQGEFGRYVGKGLEIGHCHRRHMATSEEQGCRQA